MVVTNVRIVIFSPAQRVIPSGDLIFRPLGKKLHRDDISRLTPPLMLEESAVSLPLSAPEVLNREFLELRAKVLELAASLDRLDRAHGDVAEDPRLAKLRRGMEILLSTEPDRAERVQLLFSRAYDDQWQATLKLDEGRSAKLPR